MKVHPARFVPKVPEFFIKFLTVPRNVVLDPFGGSNVVGATAESLKRRWISIELDEEYVVGSGFRFDGVGQTLLPAWRATQEQGEGGTVSTR